MEHDYPEDLKSKSYPVVGGYYQDEKIIDGVFLHEVELEGHSTSPHKYIGALLSYNSKRGKTPIRGSGVLISPDLVLTSAHNVWDREQ
jgi:hypothetical protein